MVKGGEEESWFSYSFVARGTMVLGVYRELPGDRRPVPAEAAVFEQQVHLLLRPPYLQFPRPRWLRILLLHLLVLLLFRCDEYDRLRQLEFIRQDLTTGKMIGSGHERGGMYYLDDRVSPTGLVAAYCVVAKESVPKHVSVAFLEWLKGDFKKRYGGGKADTATARSLDKEFGRIIKEHMQYIVEHADEIEKLSKVRAQVSEIKCIMLEILRRLLTEGRSSPIMLTRQQICTLILKISENKGQWFVGKCGSRI